MRGACDERGPRQRPHLTPTTSSMQSSKEHAGFREPERSWTADVTRRRSVTVPMRCGPALTGRADAFPASGDQRNHNEH
jgi:hypothetical protein